MSRSPLEWRDVAANQVQFSTGGPLAWVNEAELDSARLTIRRFGVAYLKRNAVDEADVTVLANAIRDARAKAALA
jgi:hypothetical protein